MCVCVCVCVRLVASPVQLFATTYTIALQPPLSMEFSWQEYWNELPFPPLGDLPNPEIEAMSPESPLLTKDFFLPLSHPRNLQNIIVYITKICMTFASKCNTKYLSKNKIKRVKILQQIFFFLSKNIV